MMKVAVLGGGAWGTALGAVARRDGADVHFWVRDGDVARDLIAGRNEKRLPGVPLPDGLMASTDIADVVQGADIILMAVPTQSVRDVCSMMVDMPIDGRPVAICAKGIERQSLMLVEAIIAEKLPTVKASVLTGPTFAKEVARGLPTAIVLASHHHEASLKIQQAIGQSNLRTYLSDDPVGAEVGGALKNVIAVAVGICTGAGLGENARAALVSRGLAETMRLAQALGGKPETIMGLAGAGDLILTAMSATSRNTAFGIDVGKGVPVAQALKARGAVVEGYWSTQAVQAIAKKQDVEMPITRAVQSVLTEGISVRDVIDALLERPAGSEFREL